jgi:hypothetical protein
MGADGFWKWITRLNALWSLAIKIFVAVATIGGGTMALFAWVGGWHFLAAALFSIVMALASGSVAIGLLYIISLLRQRTPKPPPPIAGPQVQPPKRRLTGRFPLIRGRWRNLEGKDLSISIKQTEGCGDFDGTITGEQDSARVEGRVTEEGQISAIAYFLDRGKADKEEAQYRHARLSPDGTLIEGVATTASGSHKHDFRWQFCE